MATVSFKVRGPVRRISHEEIEKLNREAHKIRIDISMTGKYVQWSHVMRILLDQHKYKDIDELGLRKCDYLGTIHELLMIQSKIDAYLDYSDIALAYLTIHEVEQMLCKYCNVTTFSELYVGSIYSNENIRKIFQLPDGVETSPLIRYSDLFSHLSDYMDKEHLWTTNIDPDKFKSYLMEKYNVDDKNKLGVKIRSIGLLIGSLKNVKRIHNELNVTAKEKIKSDLMCKLENQRQWLLKRIGEKLTYFERAHASDFQYFSHKLENVTRFSYSNSIEAIEMLLNEFAISVDPACSKKISELLSSLKNDRYLKSLFHLGLCFSSFSINCCFSQYRQVAKFIRFTNDSTFFAFLKNFFEHLIFHTMSQLEIEDLLDRIFASQLKKVYIVELGKQLVAPATAVAGSSSINQMAVVNGDRSVPHKPTIYELNGKIKEILNKDSNLNSVLSLSILSNIEEKICKVFSCDQFTKLGHGSFLHFLTQNENLLDEFQSTILTNKKTIKSVSMQKKYFITHLKQLYKSLNENRQSLEGLLLKHYGISSVSELGYGTFESLLKSIEKSVINETDQQMNSNSLVIYETVLLDEHLNDITATAINIDVNTENLVKIISECPVLENLVEYTNWNLFYAQKHGNIKDFVQQYAANTNIKLLEVNPIVLLKLYSNSDTDQLKVSIANGDALNSAGHLVSLISVKYGSMKKAPIKLLQNEITTALCEFLVKANEMDSAIHSKRKDEFSQFFSFISNFLYCLPLKFASNCLNCFFFDTLGKCVSGSIDAIYKQVALFEDMKVVKRLHDLGKLCELKEWSLVNLQHYLKNREYKAHREYRERILLELETKQIVTTETAVEDNGTVSNEAAEISTVVMVKAPPEIPTNHFVVTDSFEECKLHIEDIRKNKFGADLVSTEETKSIIKNMKEMLGRSLEKLSKDLYNEDIHFVLELIQNSDDSSYPSKTSNDIRLDPTLVFLVEPDRIVLLNNEIGFSRENLIAICDVGKSTKKKQQGFIGRKGIGFKSVFKITNAPEIHSNDYHLKFDVLNGDSIGYILPIPSSSNEISANSSVKIDLNRCLDIEGKYGKMNTCIHIPLKLNTDIERRKSEAVANSFADIDSSLLLFLNRLKNLVIIRKYPKQEGYEYIHQTYHRHDVSENIIKMENGNGETSKWLIAKERVNIPENLKPNKFTESTDISLAFPVCDMLDDDDEAKFQSRFRKYDVYAYLPIKDFGFSFIIQADFEVPSSRQDVLHDSYWNQMLLERIPHIFSNSIKLIKSYFGSEHEIRAIETFIKFIPVEDEIVGFFKNVPKQIFELLKNVEFLLVENPGQDLLVKKPIECVTIADKNIRDLLTPKILFERLGKYYLHPKLLESNINMRTLHSLGVHQLNINDILETLRHILNSEENMFADGTYTAKWLVALKRCLDHASLEDEESIYSQLKCLKFIPVQNGTRVKLEQTGVFFPCELKAIPLLSALKTLLKEINIVDMDLLLCLDNHSNSLIRSILEELGVKQINEKTIIDLHILPNLKSMELVMKMDKKLLVEYTVCIYSYWLQDKTFDLNPVVSSLPILTNQGLKDPLHNNEICFSLDYGNHLNLDARFPYYEWCYLDKAYLDFSGKENRHENWRQFFTFFGICDFNSIVQRKHIFNSDEIKISQFSQMAELLPTIRNNEAYAVTDFYCPVFDYYIKLNIEGKIDRKQVYNVFHDLYKVFEVNWKTAKSVIQPFNSFLFVKISVLEKKSGKECKTNLLEKVIWESDFHGKMKTQKWIVAKVFNDYDLFQPTDVYVASNLIKSYYGVKIPYIAYYEEPYEENDDHFLVHELGIRCKFHFNEFFYMFQQWCNGEQAKHNAPDLYSLSQMKAIYKILDYQLKKGVINNEFLISNAIIFIPDRKDNDYTAGTYYYNHQVFVSDSLGLFKKYQSDVAGLILEDYYNDRDVLGFFEKMQVNIYPSPEAYTELISEMEKRVQEEKLDFYEAVADTYKIFGFLMLQYYDIVKKSGSKESYEAMQFIESLKRILTIRSIWPTVGKAFVPLALHPLMVDNLKLAESFDGKIHLLSLPNYDDSNGFQAKSPHSTLAEETNTDILPPIIHELLRNVCNINYVSEAITQLFGTSTELLKPAPTIQNLFRKVLFYVQCFLVNNKSLRSIYEDCKQNKIEEVLSKMKFYSVNNIETGYQYVYNPDVSILVKQDSYYDAKGNLFYFLSAISTNEQKLLVQFVDIFARNNEKAKNELSKFVKLIQPYLSIELTGGDRKDIEREHGIRFELPVTEIRWEIDEAKEHVEVIINAPTRDLSKLGPSKKREYSLNLNQQQLPDESNARRLESGDFNHGEASNESSDVKKVDRQHTAAIEESSEIESSKQVKTDYTDKQESDHVNLEDIVGSKTNRMQNAAKKENSTLDAEKMKQNHHDKGDYTHNKGAFQLDKIKNSPKENIYEEMEPLEVNWSEKLQNFMLNNAEQEGLTQIGNYGELWVSEMLKKKYENEIKNNMIEIIWLNETEEKGEPYDLEIRFKNENAERVEYLEVKSTVGNENEKKYFPVSLKQLIFATKNKEEFCVYRLFNVGSGQQSEIKCGIIRDVANKINNHSIGIFMVI